MKRSATEALVARARAQGGVLGRADVARLGGGCTFAELLAQGVWSEVLPGVLAPAAVESTPALLEPAAMLWEPRSVLSHASAARRNGFWVPDDERVWVTTEFEGPKRRAEGLRVVRSRSFELQHLREGLVRWTRPERTLVDLSMTLTRLQLEASLLSAVRVEATTAAAVTLAAQPLRTRPGVSTLLALTALWLPERESLLEDRLDEDVRWAAPDENVVRQYVLERRGGRVQARIDVAIPALRLAFEADGLHFHSTDVQIAADQARDRALMARGWLTARYREGALDDRTAVRHDVRAIVDRRRRDQRAA